MKNAIILLSEMEQQCLSAQLPQNENGKFAAFIKSCEKTVLSKIIRSSRRKALQMKDDEVPPRVYTNQSKNRELDIFSQKDCSWVFKKGRCFQGTFC